MFKVGDKVIYKIARLYDNGKYIVTDTFEVHGKPALRIKNISTRVEKLMYAHEFFLIPASIKDKITERMLDV